MNFKVKDSGKRESFSGGMVRDVAEDKIDYTLVLDGPMFKRWAEHLAKGAKKYDKRNWMLAEGQAELDRFRESALRHMIQWLAGDRDEDHAAAVIFNLNGAEYVQEKILASVRVDYEPGPESLGEPVERDLDYTTATVDLRAAAALWGSGRRHE